MIRVHPEQRIGDQVIGHLGAAVVVDQRAPVAMLAPARVRVLIEVGAVETSQSVLVLGKVRRNPVQDHSDPRPVAAVDQVLEVVRRAIAPSGGEKTDRLVAPGTVEGVLAHRHQLDVRKAHVHHIGNNGIGELSITEPPIPVLGHAPPGAEMHLVDADRAVDRAALGIRNRSPDRYRESASVSEYPHRKSRR